MTRSKGRPAVLAVLVAGAAMLTAAMAPAPGVSPVRYRPAAASKPGNASLSGVAAVSRSNVWAFGCKSDALYNDCVSALIEHWNGRRWTVTRSPAAALELDPVSGASARNAWAVGFGAVGGGATGPLAVHWNGRRWRQVPTANQVILGSENGSLNTGAAISARNVWATGTYGSDVTRHILIEHWNGIKWRQVPSPNPLGDDALGPLAVLSPSNIWAVGSQQNVNGGPLMTLVEHWNGRKWTVVPSPNPNFATNSSLNGVSALSARNIWAVGEFTEDNVHYETLIEHWNGVTWQIVPSPSPADEGDLLYNVAAISAHNVWAVGEFDHPGGNLRLVEHWNGTAWQTVPVPGPSPASWWVDLSLSGIAALSASNIWATGAVFSGSHTKLQLRTVIEHWNGKKWSLVPSPSP